MSWSADDALKHWQNKGLLTEKKAKELASALTGNDHFDQHGMPKAVSVFATVGAVLVGLGVLLFIGSNWGDMTPFQRVATLFLGYGVCAAAAYVTEQKQWEKTSEALWLLTDIVFGANIMLLAQIFHYSLTYWQGPALWAAGALAMGYARQHKVHAYLVVPLVILALGWIDSGSGWFFGGQFAFLGSEHNLLPILPIIGAGLASISVLLRKRATWKFMHEACMSWGALLIAVPLIASTFDAGVPEELFEMTGTVKQWLLIGTSLGLVSAAIFKGDMMRKEAKVYIAVVTALFCVLLIQHEGKSGVGVVFDSSDLYYFLYLLVVFALSLWTVWVGILCENSKMVNFGIVIASIIIIVQYFSWSFVLLDKSLAFILGGSLLIFMTIFIEKKRRTILSSFD